MQRTIQDLKMYDRAQYSWFGRINILKMNIVNFFSLSFSSHTYCGPPLFFVTLQTVLSGFIWGCNKPRLQYRMLSLPKAKGGAPDLYYYHAAAVLTRLFNTFHHFHLKQWVHIEQLIASNDLLVLPWLDISSCGPLLSLSFLTAHLLCVWDKLTVQLGLSPKVRQMTPLFGNPRFTPAVAWTRFLSWSKESTCRISQILCWGTLLLLLKWIHIQQHLITH